MYEVLRWFSIACMWLAVALNIYAMTRSNKAYKKMKETESVFKKMMADYEGRPPVVYCCECDYYEKAEVNEKGFLICPASGMDITPNDYCSYSERKESKNETAEN